MLDYVNYDKDSQRKKLCSHNQKFECKEIRFLKENQVVENFSNTLKGTTGTLEILGWKQMKVN